MLGGECYLVKKPLSAAGVSEDNVHKAGRLAKKERVVEAKSRKLEIWGQSFSRGVSSDIPQAGKGLFIL